MSFSPIIKWSPSDYASASVIAREAGTEMLARLDWMTLQPKTIVDMGCGTGEMSAGLRKRYPDAHVLALDMSEEMIQYTKEQDKEILSLCADALKLPFKNQSVDLIFANFLLPWHPDTKSLLREWRRVLHPDGLLMFTVLGLDTMREWREIMGPEQCVPQLMDMHDVGDLLLSEGFAEPVLDVDYYTTKYQEKKRLTEELCASGMIDFSISPLPSYVEMPLLEGGFCVTYEIIYAHAFAPSTSHSMTDDEGVTKISLKSLRQMLFNRAP